MIISLIIGQITLMIAIIFLCVAFVKCTNMIHAAHIATLEREQLLKAQIDTQQSYISQLMEDQGRFNRNQSKIKRELQLEIAQVRDKLPSIPC